MTSIALFATLFVIFFPYSAQSQEQGSVNQITDMQINLKIDSISVGESPTGLILVEGTVYNNSTENIADVRVKVDLFNSSGELITETTRFINPASYIFKPGYERDFDFLVTARDINHYTIAAYGDKVQ
jgi:hypothetical protein